jgi:hypothetical protein
MARGSARSSVTDGRTSATSAWFTSSGPPSTRTTLRSSSSVADRTTTVVPPPQPLYTPGTVTNGSVVAPSLKRQSPMLVASSTGLAVNSSVWPMTASMPRTWSSGGVRGMLDVTRRRTPSWSAVMTTRPSSSTAGAPCTSSTQTSSLSSNTTVVVPVAGSAANTSTWRWSRLCTVSTIRSGSGHCTSTR